MIVNATVYRRLGNTYYCKTNNLEYKNNKIRTRQETTNKRGKKVWSEQEIEVQKIWGGSTKR